MNMINKGFLQLALLPKGVYKRMGVDIGQLQSVLIAKLTMDDRRPNTFHQTQRRRPDKPISASTLGTILVSAFLGLLYLAAFSLGEDMVTKLTFYFSFFFFMLAASLISDFTAVLFDVRDHYILLPRPVNDRTMVTARVLHIFIHICKLIMPMSLPGLIFILVRSGAWAGIAFMLMILMMTLFVIFFINALYLFILKFTTPQKFQSVISYIQIVFAIVLYGSYQIVPRLMNDLEGLNISGSPSALYLALPPYWFAAGWQFIYSITGGTREMIAAAGSLLIPTFSLYMVVKYLAPSFNNRLAMIGSATGEKEQKKIKRTEGENRYLYFLSRLFTKKGPERMGFVFTWKMSSRSRDFRLKVYPSIGYIVVYVVIVLLQSKGFSIESIRSEERTGKILLVSALYVCSYLPIMAINQSNFSEKFKASWIFHIAPVQKPGTVILGSIKASMTMFLLPLALAITTGSLLLIGLNTLPNIVLGVINQILLSCLIAYISQPYLPFSAHEGNERKTGAFIRGVSSLVLSLIAGTIHYLIYDHTPVVIICILLSLIAIWGIMNSINHLSWERIIKAFRQEL